MGTVTKPENKGQSEMQSDIATIKNFKIIDGAFSAKGSRLVAAFTITANGFHITGCGLVEKEDGSVMLIGPRGTTQKGHAITVNFMDLDLADNLADRAASIYRGITGRSLTVGYRVKD